MASRSQLCAACCSLLFEQPPGGSDTQHLSGKELRACAESRTCSLCANLWSRCSDIQQADLCRATEPGESAGRDEAGYVQCSYSSNVLHVTLPIPAMTRIQHYGSDRPQQVELSIQTPALGFQSITDVARRKMAGTTFSIETAKLAKQWIDNCTRRHTHSKFPRLRNILPTRLLAVGTVQEPVLRLYNANTISKDVEYTILSHRWIPGKIHRLLESNKDAYSKAMPSQLLSKNFNDAFVVTRMLDIKYIWIDSLCIVQDSATDWAREAARMAAYYEGSYCTLSATASTEHDGGLILDRDVNVVLPAFYDFRRPVDEDNKNDSVFKKVLKASISAVKAESQPKTHLLPVGKYVLADGRSWYREVDASPLNTRGWCYQERLLSSRILHFCKTRIFFECAECKCSEDGIHGIPKDVFVQDVKGNSPQAHLLKLKKHGAYKIAQLAHTIWANTVSEYSARELTFAKDRLVALAGVAQHYRALMSLQPRSDKAKKQIKCHQEGQKLPDYFMGIWLCDDSTLNNLCWSTAGTFVSRPEELRETIPSWSYGSVTSAVSFAATQGYRATIDNVVELAGIAKVDVDFKTEQGSEAEWESAMWTSLINPGTGALWLAGHLIPVSLSTQVIRDAEVAEDPRRHLIEAGTWSDHPLLIVGDEVQRWGWQADALRSGSEDDNHGWSGQYFVMAICAIPAEGHSLHGIVLEHTNMGNGCYRRIGSVYWNPPEVENGLKHYMAHVDHGNLDPKFYETQAEEGRVIIKII